MEAGFQLLEGCVVALDFKAHCPLLGGVVGSRDDVDEVFIVVMALMLAKGLMDAGVDELAVVLLLAEGDYEVPVALEVSVFFEVDKFEGLHGDVYDYKASTLITAFIIADGHSAKTGFTILTGVTSQMLGKQARQGPQRPMPGSQQVSFCIILSGARTMSTKTVGLFT